MSRNILPNQRQETVCIRIRLRVQSTHPRRKKPAFIFRMIIKLVCECVLEPGNGYFVSNRLMHAGAEHRGRAVNRIQMYMAKQGVPEPEASEIVYDQRTDQCLFWRDT